MQTTRYITDIIANNADNAYLLHTATVCTFGVSEITVIEIPPLCHESSVLVSFDFLKGSFTPKAGRPKRQSGEAEGGKTSSPGGESGAENEAAGPIALGPIFCRSPLLAALPQPINALQISATSAHRVEIIEMAAIMSEQPAFSTELLIDAIKQHPALFDKSHPRYKEVEFKKELWVKEGRKNFISCEVYR